MNSIIKKYKNPIIYLITIIFIFLFWLVISLAIDSNLILPSPISSIKELLFFFKDSSFYLSLLYTTLRAIIAFILSAFIATVLMILSINQNLKRAISLLVSILRGLPTMAIILILIIWMKPQITPIVVATLVLIPILYEEFINTFFLFKEEYGSVIFVYSIKKKKMLKLFFSESLDNLFNYASANIGLSLKLVISAEALALSYYGIGSIMQFSKIYLEMEKLFALALVAVILGVILQLLVKLIKKRWVK